MASADFTELLKSHERAYKSAMEVMVKHLTERIQNLESTVSSLTTSLEFSQREIDDLKKALKDYDKEKLANMKMNEALTDQIKSSKQEVKNMEERLNYQEDYSRRNNIRISGMAESGSGETWEQTAVKVTSLLADKLQLPGVELERAHRVGQRRDDKPRPVVARFTRYRDRETAMRSARKLRGTNIYFNDDLCAASQSIKNAQMPQMKQARAMGKIAYFRHTKLIVKDKPANRESSAVHPSVSGAPSSSAHDHPRDAGAVGGDGPAAGVEQEAFPPLQSSAGDAELPVSSPLAQVSGAASQEVRKNPTRSVKKK